MGKHGVLVWDRIFEGGEAKSAAELARIGNGTYYVGLGAFLVGRALSSRWARWARKVAGGQESCWQPGGGLLQRVGGKTKVIGGICHLAAWGVLALQTPHIVLIQPPLDDQGTPWAFV